MSLGLTATMELLDAVEALIADGGAVFADGAISFTDIKYVPDVVRSINAVAGDVKPSMDELKDLDRDELVAVVQKLLEVAQKAYDQFSAK